MVDLFISFKVYEYNFSWYLKKIIFVDGFEEMNFDYVNFLEDYIVFMNNYLGYSKIYNGSGGIEICFFFGEVGLNVFDV